MRDDRGCALEPVNQADLTKVIAVIQFLLLNIRIVATGSSAEVRLDGDQEISLSNEVHETVRVLLGIVFIVTFVILRLWVDVWLIVLLHVVIVGRGGDVGELGD